MTKRITSLSFEEALGQLEEIVQKLEGGELPLEESMKLYEKGVQLTAVSNRQLKEGKLKIEELKPDEEKGI